MPFGDVPGIRNLGPEPEATYKALSIQFDNQLVTAENPLEANLGTKIHQLDVYGLRWPLNERLRE
jgi:hypothetical protein